MSKTLDDINDRLANPANTNLPLKETTKIMGDLLDELKLKRDIIIAEGEDEKEVDFTIQYCETMFKAMVIMGKDMN